MTPTNQQLADRAAELITLDGASHVVGAALVKEAIMSTFDVSERRAATAIATAARRLRNTRLAEDTGPADFTLRVRLTEPQRERLQMLADRETAGNVSTYVRRALFA